MTYYREKYKLCTFIESSEKHRTTAERHEGTEPGCHTLFAYYYILCVWSIVVVSLHYCHTSEALGGTERECVHLLSVWKQEWRPTKKGWLEACSNTCFSVWTQSMSWKTKRTKTHPHVSQKSSLLHNLEFRKADKAQSSIDHTTKPKGCKWGRGAQSEKQQ